MLIFTYFIIYIFILTNGILYGFVIMYIPTVIFVQINFTNLIYFWGKAFVKNYIFVNLKL